MRCLLPQNKSGQDKCKVQRCATIGILLTRTARYQGPTTIHHICTIQVLINEIVRKLKFWTEISEIPFLLKPQNHADWPEIWPIWAKFYFLSIRNFEFLKFIVLTFL